MTMKKISSLLFCLFLAMSLPGSLSYGSENDDLEARIISGPASENVNFSINPAHSTFPAAGGTGSIYVTADSPYAWSVQSNVAWITLLYGSSYTGSAAVYFAVAANLGEARTGTLTIDTQTFTVTQEDGRISVALDNSFLIWATDGDAHWFSQASASHAGGSAVQSGHIVAAQTSWLETTVTGPVQVSFYWKVSSELGYDFLAFYVDGQPVYSLSGEVDWQQRAYFIPEGRHTLRWDYKKDQYEVYGLDGGWLDKVEVFGGSHCAYSLVPAAAYMAANGGMGTLDMSAGASCNWVAASNVPWITITAGDRGTGNGTVGYSVAANTGMARTGTVVIGTQTFTITQEGAIGLAVENTSLLWTSGGDAGWFSNTDNFYSGGSSVRSGAVTDRQTSWLETTVKGPAWVSFYWMATSSYSLDFYVDDVLVDSLIDYMNVYNEHIWQRKILSLPAGDHTLRWQFASDYGNGADEGGWLDKVAVMAGGPDCSYALVPDHADVPESGGNYTVTVQDGSACGWLVWSDASWLTVASETSGQGNGEISYAVEANTGPLRTGTLTIGNQIFTVTQSPMSIGEAVDNTSLSWETGGDAEWFGGINFAQSGVIGVGQTSWLETTVAGPAQISFSWQAIADGRLRFYADGLLIRSLTATYDWEHMAYTLPAGNHTLRWEAVDNIGFLDKIEVFDDPNCIYSLSQGKAHPAPYGEASVVVVNAGYACPWAAASDVSWITIYSSTRGWGNGTVAYSVSANSSASSRTGHLFIGTQTFTVTQSAIPLGEAVDNTALSWTTGGDGAWFGQAGYLDKSWATSGSIAIGQTSWLETQVAGPAQVTFNWMAEYGDLNLYYDGELVDSINTFNWPDGWQPALYILPAGAHTLRWEFKKTAIGYYGEPAYGSLDKVEVFGGPSCTYALSADSVNLGPSGTGGTVDVHTSSGCTWAAVSDVPWLSVFPQRGTGNGTITYYPHVNDDQFRTGTLTIGTEKVQVSQRLISLGEALDNTSLSWATGGDGDWFSRWYVQDYRGYSTAAARSGYTNENQASWIETTVTGPAQIVFYWKRDYMTACKFDFYADGALLYSQDSGREIWQRKTFPVSEGNHALRWNVEIGAWYCAGWLDEVEIFGGPDCTYTVVPSNVQVGREGGAGTVSVNAGSSCGWLAMSDVPWITIDGTGNSMQGNGTVSYSVAANSSGASRTGTIVVGAQTVTIIQEGVFVPVGEAVDNTSLSWRTGGAANWSVDGLDSYAGGSSMQSGTVGNGQKSWVETTVTGPALISFYWKASPGGYGLKYYTDDHLVFSNGENVSWQQQSYALPSGTHNLRWEYYHTNGWDGHGWLDQVEVFHDCVGPLTPAMVAAAGGTETAAVNAGSDCDWLAVSNVPWITIGSDNRGQGNGTLSFTVANNPASARTGTLTIGTQTFTINQEDGPIPVAVDNPSLHWTTGGDAEWLVDVDAYRAGGSSVQSGRVREDQSSWLETTVTGPAQVSFYWKVDALTYPADYLRFYIDGAHVAVITGDMDWQQKTYILETGNHALKWEFQTGSNYTSYPYEGGWLDKFEVLGGPQCSSALSVNDASTDARGGAYEVDVKAGSDCGWLAVSEVPWITVTSAGRGTGDGTVSYAVAGNSTLSSRTGTLIIGPQTFTVVQEGASAVPLGDAIDDTSLSWQTGGSKQWYGQTGIDYTGGSSVQSGELVGIGQSSWLETTVAGPAQISFYWKVSTPPGGGVLKFYSDDKWVYSLSGEVDWQQKIFSLPAGNHILRWVYENSWSWTSANAGNAGVGWLDKLEVFRNCVAPLSPAETMVAARTGTYPVNIDANCNWWAVSNVPWVTISSSGSGGSGPGTVSYTVAANPSGEPRTGTITIGTQTLTFTQEGIFIPLGEAVDNTSLPWRTGTGGTANWAISTDIYYTGGSAARSGAPSYEHPSRVETTVTGPARISFYWKISSGQEDSLRFYADGNLLYLIKGDIDWQQKSYFLPAGEHILKWEYLKNGWGNHGSDCSWLDKVMVINGGETLADAIRALQLMAGLITTESATPVADANGDGRIGIAEVIYTLQNVAGLR